MEYLVNSHLGGYYISDNDPSWIEEICEECGDCDIIIGSWNNEDEKYITLLDFFLENKLFNDLDNKIKEYFSYTYFDMNPIVDLLMDIKDEVEITIEFIDYFYKSGYITDDLADNLKVVIKKKEKDAYNFIKSYDYSNLSYNRQYTL